MEQRQNEPEKEKLILNSLNCCYDELICFLRAFDFAMDASVSVFPSSEINTNHSSIGKTSYINKKETKQYEGDAALSPLILPDELIRCVLQFFVVKRAQKSEIVASRASSMDMTSKRFGLSCSLENDDTTWWMSGNGTMPKGYGHEFIQFALNNNDTVLRRINSVSVCIPPMPMGPLSVRIFRVDALTEEQEWKQISPIFTVENCSGLQRFDLGNIDATDVRVVCLSNQVASVYGRNTDLIFPPPMECVGLYCVQFD